VDNKAGRWKRGLAIGGTALIFGLAGSSAVALFMANRIALPPVALSSPATACSTIPPGPNQGGVACGVLSSTGSTDVGPWPWPLLGFGVSALIGAVFAVGLIAIVRRLRLPRPEPPGSKLTHYPGLGVRTL
jgi:hypothetical protein